MTYTLQLNWQPVKSDFYPEAYEARIFYGHYLYLAHNGDEEEPYYNVELVDQNDDEVDGICGGKTVEKAKESAEKWLIKECNKFLTPND